jgi:hypothetical protein
MVVHQANFEVLQGASVSEPTVIGDRAAETVARAAVAVSAGDETRTAAATMMMWRQRGTCGMA